MADGIACAHQAAARAGAVSATRFGHVGSDRVRDGPVAWALLADYAAGSLPARTLVVPHHVIGKGSMVSEGADRITVRDATEADVPALTAMKGERSEVLHRDRLRDGRGSGFRYFVLLADQELIGSACLITRRPAYWSDADDRQHLPQIVDFRIKESRRGQGYGSNFLRMIERSAAEVGHRQLYLSVEPSNNPRAYALYQRLGYRPLQSEPYLKIWEFSDSAGNVHRGEDWIVDMVKQLKTASE